MTTGPHFTGLNGTANYRQWLIDEPRRAVAQARAEANATRTAWEDALERAGELFAAGYWSEARAVLALAMGE